MSDLMALVKAKKEQLAEASGRREKTVKVENGKHRFRILPSWKENDPQFWHDFGLHFIHSDEPDDEGKTLKTVYVCTARTFGKECPICDAIAQGLLNAPTDEAVKALEDSKANGSILVNALQLDSSDSETPVLLELRPSAFTQILEIMEEYGNVTDLVKGVDLVITREGKGFKTKYTVIPAPNSKPVDEAVMKKLHDLDKYVDQEWEEGKVKALTTVGAVAGIAVGGSAPALSDQSGGAALGSIEIDESVIEGSATVVEDDDLKVPAEEEAVVETVETEAEVEAEVEADEDEPTAEELEAARKLIGAQKKKKTEALKAKKAAEAKAKAEAEAKADVTIESGSSDAEMEAILADLDL